MIKKANKTLVEPRLFEKSFVLARNTPKIKHVAIPLIINEICVLWMRWRKYLCIMALRLSIDGNVKRRQTCRD